MRAGEESIFHTRQQHSIKVAQVGRRLAQAMKVAHEELAEEAGLDEEVVEAACLIHDLGHPPFGHVGETILDQKVTPEVGAGFEGNAQSFRIITKLAVRKEAYAGMNLTRATLAASLKYPWLRGPQGTPENRKWSVYDLEQEEFKFAREFHEGKKKTVEAELMEWADDIAYSVHDLEDFHRCGAVPWAEIFNSTEGKARIVKAMPADRDYEKSFDHLGALIFGVFSEVLRERYQGTRNQRWVLRSMTSNLISLYINSVALEKEEGEVCVKVADEALRQVRLLKQITKDHIISTPPLAAQQIGYGKIIGELYDIFHDEGKKGLPSFTPVRLRYLWELSGGTTARFAADCIASLTEDEAMAMHARLTGYISGSVLDPIIR